MEFLKALFNENSSVSSVRVMSIVCCITAIILAFVGINKTPIDYSGLSLLCGTFLGAAFTGKIVQKRIEVDSAKNPEAGKGPEL